MIMRFFYVWFLLLLAGCGNSAPLPSLAGAVAPATKPVTYIQAVRLTSTVLQADWIAQIEALNHQQQNEFGSDWETNVILVDTPPSSLDRNKLSLQLVDLLPDPPRRGVDYGYHSYKVSYVDAPTCLKGPDGQWKRTCSHEVCEMIVDIARGTTKYQVGDAVSKGYGYPVESGPAILSDYLTPAYFSLGNIRYDLGGKVIYDHLHLITFPGQIGEGGVKE